MEEKDNDIVVLQHFDNAIDANIAKTKLDAYGVPCFLTEENMANLYPGQSLYAFKTRLHIFAGDRDRAIQLLAGSTMAREEDAANHCPVCRSTRLTRGFPRRSADTLKYLLFGIFLPHKKVNQCLSCGAEF